MYAMQNIRVFEATNLRFQSAALLVASSSAVKLSLVAAESSRDFGLIQERENLGKTLRDGAPKDEKSSTTPPGHGSNRSAAEDTDCLCFVSVTSLFVCI